MDNLFNLRNGYLSSTHGVVEVTGPRCGQGVVLIGQQSKKDQQQESWKSIRPDPKGPTLTCN